MTDPRGYVRRVVFNSYAYDTAGRQTSMRVTGQPVVTYGYDHADWLTQITQSSSNTSFGYDIAGRRTSLTLPNGVAVSYTFDNNSRLTGITYQFGTNTLGNLTYSYDALGRRTQVRGGFARTGLPGVVSSATYDAGNELTNWNGVAISYDANGNMLGDGTNAFTWNARDQVATLNGVGLQYDAFGRRIKNRAGTSFLYDGANAAQELSGSTVTANLLSGGIDEVFSRADSSGAFTPLKDALGSTIALTDLNGNLQTSYTYDPFGNTSVTGTSNANEFQYTGRENDGNGLYFYRARYYSPLLGRFISEDPAGFGGGLNLYSYVFDSPTNLADPSGNCPACVAPPPVVTTTVGGAAVGATTGTLVGTGTVTGGSGSIVTLVAGGSAEGSGGGPIGALIGVIVAVGTYDVIEGHKLCQVYGWCSTPPPTRTPGFDPPLVVPSPEVMQSLLGYPKPQPLPGRESKRPGNGDADTDDVCRQALEECLNNPWQPSWNIPNFGRRKDCGACYRYCKHNDYWPTDKCPK
ncbi:MAG TPA: RHS repeat-associated core domain-containing protein [Candidatus Angelobacter sp.]